MDDGTSKEPSLDQAAKRKPDREEGDGAKATTADAGDEAAAARPCKRIRRSEGADLSGEDGVGNVACTREVEMPEERSPTPTASVDCRGSDGEFIEVDPFFAEDEGRRRAHEHADNPDSDCINYGSEQYRGQRFGIDIWPTLYSGPLPDELLAMCGTMRCALCDLRLTSAIVAKSHYLGRNHERKTNAFLKDWAQSTNEVAPRRILENMEEVRSGDERFCELCQIELTSKITAMAHYQGRNHAKQKWKLKMQQRELARELALAEERREEDSLKENTGGNEKPLKDGSGEKTLGENDGNEKSLEKNCGKEIKLEKDEDSSENVCAEVMPAFDGRSLGERFSGDTPSRRFFCMPCQADCQTRDDYDAHVNSQGHKEMSLYEISLQSQFSCPICKVQCDSRVDFDAHLQSAEHQIKEIRESVQQRQEVLVMAGSSEQRKEDEMVTPTGNNKFHCNVCQSMISGPDNLRTHLEGRQHKRKLQMTRGPESHSVVFVVPSNGKEDGLSFFCDVCQIQTTDLAGLEMHRNGRKHRKKIARK